MNDTELTGDTLERILQAATLLFAERGFNGVTVRELAAAVNLNVATIHYHTGSKRDLYLRVIRRLYVQEHELVTEFARRADEATVRDPASLRDLLVWLAESMVDMMDRNPQRPLLYMRRWMEDLDELSPHEAELCLPIYATVREVLAQAQQAGTALPDVDLGILMRSFDWLIYCHFVAGPLDWQAWRGDPRQPAALSNLKAYLRTYVCRMLGLDEAKGETDANP